MSAARVAALAALLLLGLHVPRTQAQLSPPRWSASTSARPAKAAFSVRVGAVTVPLRVMALAVLPGSRVEIAKGSGVEGRLSAVAGAGSLRSEGVDRWAWRAPQERGFYAVRIVSSAPVDTIHLTFMVARPATDVRDGMLGSYPIGTYRARPASMSAAFEPPRGFVEARPADFDILVSPNFRLGQFLCKQPGDPQYLLVSPRLLIKLEAVLAAVNVAGIPTAGLTVMSGFRTPAYNRAIGNTTDFSRHLWGDAADVYVDNDGDGDMDDLNRDGHRDVRDARWLADLVERMMIEQPTLPAGGLATYRRNPVHGPFVHVDTRGRRARW